MSLPLNAGVVIGLKRSTLRGGAVIAVSQAARQAINLGATILLARLLTPADFGLVAMVTAVTGFLMLFRDAGLSAATVQREEITQEQISTLFWVNVGLGVLLALLCAALAPVLSTFYGEPRLLWVTLALSGTFVIGATAVQHRALLRRALRFRALAIVDIVAMLVSMGTAIGMALAGCGYWSMVGATGALVVAETVGAWVSSPWRPGRPRRGCGAGSMLRFGGLLTSVNLLNYGFRNADNVLIGWYWGPGALGLYRKAYSLLMLPINRINGPISSVAVSALSRVQNDPQRLRRYFLGGFSIVASAIVPIVGTMALYADDIVAFMLGPQWLESVGLFQLLAPAALIGALLNPMGWLFIATGRADRQFKAACVWTPVIILSFVAGLPFGPAGVATAFSVMACVAAIPLLLYALAETPVQLRDIFRAVGQPTLAMALPTALGFLMRGWMPVDWPAVVRAGLGSLVVLGVYAFVLLVVMGRWSVYWGLLREARQRPAVVPTSH